MTRASSLLLTRPLHDSLALQAVLQADGYHCLIAPMLAIKPLEDAARQLEAIDPASVQAIVATSRHGFTTLPAQRDFLGKPLYVVGEHTAAAAIAQGWKEPIHIAASSRMLMPTLKKRRPDDGAFVYLRGEIVTTDLANALGEYRWHNVIAYHSIAQTQLSETIRDALSNGQIYGVLFYSRRTAQLFEQALQQAGLSDLPPLHSFCLSEFIAQDLRHPCWQAHHIAPEPSQTSLLALVRRIHKQTA